MAEGSEFWTDAETGTVVINESDVAANDAFNALIDQHPEVAALARWGQSITSRASSLFERDRYVTPDSIYDQFRVASHAAQHDDVVAGAVETSEAMAFGWLDFEASDDQGESDVWNQIAEDIDLESRMREMWREMFTVSNAYAAVFWGRKNYKVRGRTKDGNKRKKTYNLRVPVGISLLDPLKVIPVGSFMFGKERLAYIAERTEAESFENVLAGSNTSDLVVSQIIEGRYEVGEAERSHLANLGVDPTNLFLLNEKYVWRITDTRPAYERFAHVRMKSIFELLDMKSQLKAMDRAHLLGATNFIILIKKGTDEMPAKPSEVAALAQQVRSGSRIPVIIGDHRLEIEIITPQTDMTLKAERYNSLDSRITARLYGLFEAGGYCVSPDTEIFTENGWTTHDSLSTGDSVLTLNTETGMSEWGAVGGVHVFDHDGPMFSMEGMAHSSLSTLNHRWFVSQIKGMGREPQWEWRTSDTLTAGSRIPTHASCSDLPIAPTHKDEVVELVAWFWNEGHFAHNQAFWAISQSPTANPAYCARIENLLRSLFGPPSVTTTERDPVTGRFQGGESWREWGSDMYAIPSSLFDIREFVDNNKVPTIAFVKSLTQEQLDRFINVSVDGDGCRSDKEQWYQKNPEGLARFEMACILAGRGVRIQKVNRRNGVAAITLLKPKFTNPVGAASRRLPGSTRVEIIDYEGKIWCPETPNGTWLARRNNTIYWTGNTAGAKGDDSIKLAKMMSRVLEARRNKIIRSVWSHVVKPTMDLNKDKLDSETVRLYFHPKRIALDLDPSLMALLQDLRDRGDLSRESILDEAGYTQEDEAVKREREAEIYDKVFRPVNVPFDSPNKGTPGKPPVTPQPMSPEAQKRAGRQGGRNPDSFTPNAAPAKPRKGNND